MHHSKRYSVFKGMDETGQDCSVMNGTGKQHTRVSLARTTSQLQYVYRADMFMN